MRPRWTSIDVFAGAGGLAAALEQAGFSTMTAIDRDFAATAALEQTRAARLPIDDQPGQRHLEDTSIVTADVDELLARGRAALVPPGVGKKWRPDVLAGGPPCQPFSSAGHQRGVEDPRGHLFRSFVAVADLLRPRYVLFENVRGLLTQRSPDGRPGGVLEMIQASFEEIGYATRFATLNAADYGAAQRRVRLYMIATADYALVDFPAPTHSRNGPTLDTKRWISLGEFLSSQPEPDPADVVRPSGRRAAELEALAPGTGLRTGGVVEANRPGGHWGYRQDCFLADPDLPARTVRAAATPDWIRLPDQSLRRLTWRECAGLQGFPPGWCFTGSLTVRMRQIGNAVCIPVGRAVAEAIGAGLAAGPASVKPTAAPWPEYFRRRIDYTAMEERVNGAYRRRR